MPYERQVLVVRLQTTEVNGQEKDRWKCPLCVFVAKYPADMKKHLDLEHTAKNAISDYRWKSGEQQFIKDDSDMCFVEESPGQPKSFAVSIRLC